MLAPMSAKTESDAGAKNSPSIMRAEFPLLIGVGTAAIFFGTGSRLVEIIAHPVVLVIIFFWLFCRYSLVCNFRGAACRLSCH